MVDIAYLVYYTLITFLFLSWGSFLNALAYRLVENKDIIFKRSVCPKCNTQLKWYDLIPILSYIQLKGRCRYCKEYISYLYPLIEILTAVCLWLSILLIEPQFWLGYFTFISALIVTIRTDVEYLLISRYATLYLIPVAFILSYFNAIKINFIQSFIGALISYLILYVIAQVFLKVRKKKGLGEGDPELLGFIGSFIGLKGAWFSVLYGSLLALLSILLYVLRLLLFDIFSEKKKINISPLLQKMKIPFGLWLSIAALIFLFIDQIDHFIVNRILI